MEPKTPPQIPTGFQIARAVALDASILVGGALLTYGAWQCFHPAAFLVSGGILLFAGLNGARRT